jgi:hypothetical protein
VELAWLEVVVRLKTSSRLIIVDQLDPALALALALVLGLGRLL